jgi:pimeloyl-ACP methyl ester carboxylesterase
MRSFRIVFFAIATIATLAALYSFKSFTPPIFSGAAIAELTPAEINGDRQWLLIRGRDRSAPVLLFLHGGPGMPAMYLAHAFQRDLERHFVVVHWDQRGAGKSFRNDLDPATLTISQLLADTDVVVEYLRKKFHTEKVWLVGHSHGSYLGVLYARRHPGKVAAFIGVGQVADFERERPTQDAFLRSRFADLGLPEDAEISDENREELLFRTGSEIHGETSFLPLVYSGLRATEYSLFDILNVAKGSSFSSANMKYDHSRNLIADERDFAIPVAVMMGAFDMTTPRMLAREYFGAIDAPDKRWIDFERSAHFPFYEQPEDFTAAMIELKRDWEK